MLERASRKAVFPVLRKKYGSDSCNDMVTVLAQEIVRQKPVDHR
jgi:hypothetical protein